MDDAVCAAGGSECLVYFSSRDVEIPREIFLLHMLLKIKRDSEAERDLHLLHPFPSLPLSSHLLHLHGMTPGTPPLVMSAPPWWRHERLVIKMTSRALCVSAGQFLADDDPRAKPTVCNEEAASGGRNKTS